jgi:hypothetical protein
MVRLYEAAAGFNIAPDGRSFMEMGASYQMMRVRIDTLDELKAWIGTHRYVRPLTCEERALYNVVPLCAAGPQ